MVEPGAISFTRTNCSVAQSTELGDICAGDEIGEAISNSTTDPKFHSSFALRVVLYHSVALGASVTASITEIESPRVFELMM